MWRGVRSSLGFTYREEADERRKKRGGITTNTAERLWKNVQGKEEQGSGFVVFNHIVVAESVAGRERILHASKCRERNANANEEIGKRIERDLFEEGKRLKAHLPMFWS